MWRLVAAVIAVVTLGIGSLYWQTDGFTALTAETARRNQVAAHPRPVPDALVATADGDSPFLRAALQSDGRVAIVDFIYTRCMSICLAMGSEFQQLQSRITEEGLGDRVRLLSISFDPQDDPRRLAAYARQMRADPTVWSFVTPARPDELAALLKAFGIVVIPDELGQFQHNAAYHVVTADGRLARVVDFNEQQRALDAALAIAARDARDASTTASAPPGKGGTP